MQPFDIEHFLRHYWQQKPVVLKAFFNNFDDPIDEHDLAGLAQEEDIDSRIISYANHDWQVHSGPFEDFETVCQGAWTLLVQGVDRYIHDAASIIEPFRFIPNWRLDDLMVSFATQGAGVGAHIDQYDVFLVQGKGQRRWRVGEPGNYKDVFPHPKLRQIEGFTPIIDEVLKPGDVLYIPPGWPHDGRTIKDCLTYSVGFRAPDCAQLADSLAIMLEQSHANLRFTDAQRAPSLTPALVNNADIEALKTQLKDVIDSPEFTRALLASLSEQGIPEFPQDILYSLESISAAFLSGVTFSALPGIRPIMGDAETSTGETAFYINGEHFTYAPEDIDWVMLLITQPIVNVSMRIPPPSSSFLSILTSLVNKGYWEWLEEPIEQI